jgi:hypothetical protein
VKSLLANGAPVHCQKKGGEAGISPLRIACRMENMGSIIQQPILIY